MNKIWNLVFWSGILVLPIACVRTDFPANEKIDLHQIYSLNAPFEVLKSAPENQFTLMIYYPRLACNSCVNEIMVHVTKASKSYRNIDFVLVSGESGYYLSNIKRVRQIEFPIFVERVPGEAGIQASSLALFLVDAQTGNAIFKFVPLPGEKDIRFKKFLNQVISYVEAHTIKI